MRTGVRSAAALSCGATLLSTAHQAISFADVTQVAVAPVVVKRKKRMIAKSVYVEKEEETRSTLLEWVR